MNRDLERGEHMEHARTRAVRVGADIGGTFTDVAAIDSDGNLRIGKQLTSHGAEHGAVVSAIGSTGLGLDDPELVVAHGTTLVINALLERRGVRTALVTTAGFADALDIGRANRTELFNIRFRREAPLVPPELRFELAERTLGDGSVEAEPETMALAELAAQLRAADVDSIAIGLVNSYRNPANERAVSAYLRQEFPELTITASSDISRQWREYERFTTATANAYVTPVARRYIGRIVEGIRSEGFEGQFVVLDSSGGAMTQATAETMPVRAVESGPVAGVVGARKIAEQLSIENLVTFDMGGTTSKACMIESGHFATTDLYWVGGYKRGLPLQVNTVDVLETGVGGGSIAWLDEAGRLRIGPRSAGSVPGPACYGRGGTEPTVTDANLYCGRLDREHFVGSLTLDYDAAARAIENLASRAGMTPARLALGIIELANLQISGVVRRQTLERGRDPRDFTLLAIGGAGPMHACEVAIQAGVSQVLVPRFPGHFSALGMLEADLRVDRRESYLVPVDDFDSSLAAEIVDRITSEIAGELPSFPGSGAPTASVSAALRYRGQEHALWVRMRSGVHDSSSMEVAKSLRAEFEGEYERRYGHLNVNVPVEIVELEVVMERGLRHVVPVAPPIGARPSSTIEAVFGGSEERLVAAVVARDSLGPEAIVSGPAVIYEEGSTTVIPPGAVARVVDGGNLLVRL